MDRAWLAAYPMSAAQRLLEDGWPERMTNAGNCHPSVSRMWGSHNEGLPTGRVIATSGLMLTIAWDSGEETNLIPGAGTLSVVKRGRRQSPSKAAKTSSRARGAQKSPGSRRERGICNLDEAAVPH